MRRDALCYGSPTALLYACDETNNSSEDFQSVRRTINIYWIIWNLLIDKFWFNGLFSVKCILIEGNKSTIYICLLGSEYKKIRYATSKLLWIFIYRLLLFNWPSIRQLNWIKSNQQIMYLNKKRQIRALSVSVSNVLGFDQVTKPIERWYFWFLMLQTMLTW